MITVTVQKNGKYWQARWRQNGQQKSKGLGAMAKVSKRAAGVKAKKIEAAINGGHAASAKAPALQDYIDKHIDNRTDLSESTKKLYRITGRYLVAYLGAKRRIDRITRADAADWRAALAKGKLSHVNTQDKGAPCESTVCRSAKEAKAMFKAALAEDRISFNPFDRIRASAPTPDKTWEYIDMATANRLLDACPSDGWRLLFALCRYAGLRRGEAMQLRWADIDMDRRRIVVNNGITHQDTKHRRRETPIIPELHEILFAAFMDGHAGDKVITHVRVGSLSKIFAALTTRAGVSAYARPCHTLRKNIETDWMEEYPVMVVCEWLGHSPGIAAKHYHKTKDEQFERAAGLAKECSQDRYQPETETLEEFDT